MKVADSVTPLLSVIAYDSNGKESRSLGSLVNDLCGIGIALDFADSGILIIYGVGLPVTSTLDSSYAFMNSLCFFEEEI